MRFNPFLLVACLLQTALTPAVALTPSEAEACASLPPDYFYYTFLASDPGDGATNVPLDGAVLLTPRYWQVEGRELGSPLHANSGSIITVTDVETGQVVTGKVRGWWFGEHDDMTSNDRRMKPYGMAWIPEPALLPHRRYELVATLRQSQPRPPEAEGVEELRMSFSTGAQVSPPLELLGELEVTLESYEADKLRCLSGKCACDKIGQERALRARVRVPGIQGGDPLDTYRIELWITDAIPYDIANHDRESRVIHRAASVSKGGDPTEMLFRVPAYDTPCFAWRVVDPAGHAREGTPVCLKNTVGCTVGPGPSRSTAFLALLAAVFTVWRARRRRLALSI